MIITQDLFEEMKFPFLQFNLAKNYVHGAESVNLQYLSMSTFIGKLFAQPCVLSKINNLKNLVDEEDSHDIRIQWNEIEEKVMEEIEFRIPFKTLKPDFRFMVSLVRKEIFELLTKSVADSGYQSLFLNNLVFNSQGKINTLGTILKILKKSDLSELNKFLIACKYFVGKVEMIKFNEEHYLPALEYLAENYVSCDEACVTVYFWLWHIYEETYFLEEIIPFFESRGIKFMFDGTVEYCALRYMFRWALKMGNETAIQYIYDNFISKNPKKDLILKDEFAIVKTLYYDTTNVIVYIISNVREGEPVSWFNDIKWDCLRRLRKQTRWNNAFYKFLKSLLISL